MSSEQTVEHSIMRAKAAGYSIHETDAPPCMEQVLPPPVVEPAGTVKLYDAAVMVPCPPDRNFVVKHVWGCPPDGAVASGGTSIPLPAGQKPDLLPVAAGVGVVGLLAAVAGGLFGK